MEFHQRLESGNVWFGSNFAIFSWLLMQKVENKTHLFHVSNHSSALSLKFRLPGTYFIHSPICWSPAKVMNGGCRKGKLNLSFFTNMFHKVKICHWINFIHSCRNWKQYQDSYYILSNNYLTSIPFGSNTDGCPWFQPKNIKSINQSAHLFSRYYLSSENVCLF